MVPLHWKLALAYGAVLLAIHLVATGGRGALPPAVNRRFGSNAGSVLPRWWAQFTAPWFHETWFHIGYNQTVMLATMPLALAALGPVALLVALAASPMTGYAVNLLLVLPLARRWSYARAAVEPRLVGASVVIFAGAGVALATWDAPGWARVAVAGAVGLYETVLAKTGLTKPFVGFYHMGGFVVGLAAGLLWH